MTSIVKDYGNPETRKIAEEGRVELEAKVGKVWNTKEVQAEFEVHGFGAPYISVTRKADGVKGSLEFTHMPRYYFNFVEK